MFADMDTRTKLGLGFMVLVPVVALLMTLDYFMFRPREEIFPIADRIVLENEFERIIVTTSDVGVWENRRTIHRTRLVVAAKFSGRSADHLPAEILVEALKKNAWRTYQPVSSHSVATFCKGKYRAEIELMDTTGRLVSLAFLVKEFQRDVSCGDPYF